MIITTITSERIRTVSLPEKAAGQYWLYEDTEKGTGRLVSVEGIDTTWYMKSNRDIRVLGENGKAVKSVALVPMQTYALQKKNGEIIVVYTEPATDDRQIFHRFSVPDGMKIRIGKSLDCDIIYDRPIVSQIHATLAYVNNVWQIRDENSKNGVYVNGRRCMGASLKPGDCIYIMGLRIIVGKKLIAFNNPDCFVRISEKLKPFVPQQVVPPAEGEEYELPEESYFYRSPRFKRDVETAAIKIDSPPSSPIGDEMPIVLVLGSSMAMGMMSLITLSTAIINGNVTSMVMGGSMMIGTLLLPILTKRYERNRKRKKEDQRQRRYREYLQRISAEIMETGELQESILKENIISTGECETRIINRTRTLWDRAMGQNDYLVLRLGVGDAALDAEISYQERRFTIEDDYLQDELYSLCEKPKLLHNVPVSFSLFENPISGVIGDRQRVIKFAQGLLIQLVSFYSYDELKLVFLVDPEEEKDFEFVKWLPHVWNDEKTFRYIATDETEVKEISAYLENMVDARREMNEKDIEEEKPYYIIFSMSSRLAARSEMLKEILAHRENMHISVVAISEDLQHMPRECSMVIDLTDGRGRLYDKDDTAGKSINFTPDIFPTRNPLELGRLLANTSLDTVSGSFALPKTITFLELFGVGKVEHLNALTRWKENDPTKSLQAAVGVDTLGGHFYLDLHEKFHGPHGLVAGMTGSGKSEFIITYILSLALNYHPNEVAFILIDYKGGGMAKSFEHLPHTAGIITNLDGAAIKRSLVSIESELKRRQAIFAAAGKKVGVSNIDIYKYQKLYREGRVDEPLQHLFIISDEFAELKTQQPEFMTQLVSAARIGRSLGVHLILATQKPSGVVDDQIWSNSKFRVCLKVQERADSMDMLKRPDAAELKDTGRFYLQVGYNELFELGQSAWAGAPYYPSDRVEKEKDDSIAVVDRNGHVLREVKPNNKKGSGDGKQLDVITDYIKRIAEEENIHIRPLWLDPIPAVILLDEVRKKYHTSSERFVLNPVIGEYDDPARQRQDVLRLPLSKEGNAVVYGSAGAGKTAFLNAMLYSLIEEHTPEEVNIYVLDFASETLRAFQDAPHVGDVILSYESEKISNLFKMLQKESERRKKLFADYGGDYDSYISASGNTLPNIVVAINNFAAFTESYEEKEAAVSFLSREGTKYGIYFVLTSLGTGGVRFRLLQNFGQLFTLQLNDESEYSTVVGKTDGLYPSKYEGRGLVKTDSLYEFQIASITRDVPYQAIREFCRKKRASYTGPRAERIPILPETVDIEFLQDHLRQDRPLLLPVGVEKNSLNVHMYPFDRYYISLVLAAGNDYKGFIAKLAEFAGGAGGLSGVVFDPQRQIEADTGSIRKVSSAKDVNDEVAALFDTVLYRNNTWKDAQEAGTPCEEFPLITVFINALAPMRDMLDETNSEKLQLILEKGSAEYRIHIIIGDQQKSLTIFNFEKWFKANVSLSDGIWVGAGITEQYQMKPNRTTSDMHDAIGPDFGYSLINGKAVRIKLLTLQKAEDEDES